MLWHFPLTFSYSRTILRFGYWLCKSITGPSYILSGVRVADRFEGASSHLAPRRRHLLSNESRILEALQQVLRDACATAGPSCSVPLQRLTRNQSARMAGCRAVHWLCLASNKIKRNDIQKIPTNVTIMSASLENCAAKAPEFVASCSNCVP